MSEMEIGSGYFLSFSALAQQIRTVKRKRKATRFVVWDRSILSSEKSSFRLQFMKSATVGLKFAIMFDTKTQCVSGLQIRNFSLGSHFKSVFLFLLLFLWLFLLHNYSFFFSYFYTLFPFPFLFRFRFLFSFFSLIFRTYSIRIKSKLK